VQFARVWKLPRRSYINLHHRFREKDPVGVIMGIHSCVTLFSEYAGCLVIVNVFLSGAEISRIHGSADFQGISAL
jgi:hypothetical protein